jgi:endonuclease YncB( thermonuclease family)
MDDWTRQYLINSGVLDTETLSREAGSGFTEIAYYNFAENKVTEFLPRPQEVNIETGAFQDEANMRSFRGSRYTAKNFLTWKDALVSMLVREYKLDAARLTNADEILKALETTNTFLWKQLKEKNAHPHLLGNYPTAGEIALREAEFRAAGIKYELGGANIPMEDIMGMQGPLRQAITRAQDPTKGSTVWIANAVFEAKQFGATLGAMAQSNKASVDQWKSVFETRSTFPEPFYVTGSEVSKARTNAQMTGNWIGVWKAYKEFTPKAGEVAVRDVQDLTRALLSYGKTYGLIDVNTKQMAGVGIDYQERLLRAAFETGKKAEQGLLGSEAHRAAEDAAKSEAYVLQRKIESLRAFDLLEGGKEEGRLAIEEARKGQGPLAGVLKYFEMYNDSVHVLRRRHLLQQYERGIGDIETKKYATHTDGIDRVIAMRQATPSGKPKDVFRADFAQKFSTTEEDYYEEVIKRNDFSQYGLDQRKEWDKMQNFIQSETERRNREGLPFQSRKELANVHVEEETGTALDSYFSANARRMLNYDGRRLAGRLSSRWAPMGLGNFVGNAAGRASKVGTTIINNVPRAGMAAVAVGALGLIGHSMSQESRVEDYDNSRSVLTMDYKEYELLRKQSDGFAETGMAKATRSMNTDFGSPYRGPATSFDVLVHQDLLEEREKYNRMKYNAVHHDTSSGLFWPFRSPFKKSTALQGRAAGEGELGNLRNTENMRVIDVDSNWEMEVEDVDTVMLKKRGFFGGVQRFFGLGGSHTFRLEGIDSTEISHGMFDKSWHTPQPGATEAIAGMKQLMSSGKLKIAYDPKDATYGRAVGTVFADGRNVNQQAVERGLAAHLPYGSYMDAHADWDALRHAEQKAVEARRGLWATPWAQTYRAFSESAGTQITFNTFARPSKMAENYQTMKLISVMEQAQSGGMSASVAEETARHIGQKWDKFGDNVKPYRMEGNTAANYRTYIGNLMQDNTNFVQTKGTGTNANKNSASNLNELNSYLAVDSLGTTNSVYSKRSLEAYKIYGADKARKREQKERMAAMQRHINSKFGDSPINHHRM